MMNRAQWKRRQFLLGVFLLAIVLFLPLGGNDWANASPLVEEKSPENTQPWDMGTHKDMKEPVRVDLEVAPLRIEKSWRNYKQIPGLFQEMAEEPEGFFSLESQGLRDLVKTALKDNPELKEAEAAWKASLKKARVVSALPDPNLAATAFVESVETRVGPQEAVLIFTQKFPWFGKLSAAGQAALEEALESFAGCAIVVADSGIAIDPRGRWVATTRRSWWSILRFIGFERWHTGCTSEITCWKFRTYQRCKVTVP